MSLSASAENLATDSQGYDGSSNMCLELALEGERLCKAGDCRAGVAFFQAAIQAGTDDLRTLSAIYSQLGNAYFYLGDYGKAMQYHKHDLTLARTMGDKLGEAKASGNLGNTLKVMGRFDEAVVCCKRQLDLSRELDDKLSEGRALYNLGNVYHSKGKHVGRVGHKDAGEFSEEVKTSLNKAVDYYEENLMLMKDLGDIAAQGRACGNLGNTYYLLGNFAQAIKYHEERLSIARQFGDKAAERRAHSNLGNSHIFMGQFEEAAHHYKKTLSLAQELKDRAVEAQACYSLGNTYTLLRDYETAIEYHLRHLLIAQHLIDRVGEGRACWSLGNAHAALGNHEKALHFATKHLEISREVSHMARARLRDRHQESLRRKLEVLRAEQVVASTSNVENVENVDSSPRSAKTNSVGDLDPSASGASHDEDNSDVEGDEEEAANALLNECFLAFDNGGYTPKLLTPDQVEPGTIVVSEQDDIKRLEFVRAQVIGTGKKVENVVNKEELLLQREARKGMGDDEAQFSVEAALDSQVYLWSDKYRPRKPRYFNRVHTGFEWNKYNQTHYDMDNPPPKIVQGYKFNIFYPDLIDKNNTPEYFLTPCPENREFAILRFHAGPPYEDIAFKIVNREWEYSYKRGFRCQFHNNIFQLWFHFKRYRYRR